MFKKEDFFVLIVDDGSDSNFTIEEINKGLCNALDIIIVRLENNRGITEALNVGLKYVYTNTTVKYIARLDCGDICTAERFEKQVAFLNRNEQVHLIGSWCSFKDPQTDSVYSYRTPLKHEEILKRMHLKNVFIHPTVMWRISGTGKLFYPAKYLFAEDYALFYEIISKVESYVIGEYLVICEVNNSGLSISNRTAQLKSRINVITDFGTSRFWKFIGILKLSVLLLIPHKLVYLLKKNIFRAT